MKKNPLMIALCLSIGLSAAFAQDAPKEILKKSASEFSQLKGKKILYVERDQYAPDHHNTETLFEWGEINGDKFKGGSAIRMYDVNSGQTTTLIESSNGLVRDPEVSFDGTRILFSMRPDKLGDFHIYEMDTDGSNLKQLTFREGISDIDPAYLPDGTIVFTSTRQPKYCMCNRHIMGNLFKMNGDGTNIHQIGFSTLFEGHSAVLADGRILYDRWEYVDRNFGDAQGLWTVNPDGTKHSIYYGNNTSSPGGVLDARQIPGTDKIVCIFAACHDQPWGAMAVLDRRKGIDGEAPVVAIVPAESRKVIGNGDIDSYKWLPYLTEDPYPLDENNFLVSSTISYRRPDGWNASESKSGIFVMNTDGSRELILDGIKSLFDPILVEPITKPTTIPSMVNFADSMGTFYVQNVYEGTHMKGVEPGSVKYLRIVESPEKRSWTIAGWSGQGEQAPVVNWRNLEVKRILGDVPVEADGSANFKAPAGKHLYFQLLDQNKQMIQTMRSGVSLMPGEVNGCVGCHEDRLTVPVMKTPMPAALKKAPIAIAPWQNKKPRNFSYAENVQPIWDKHCLKCHDFDPEKPEKLVLAGDKNMFFNASYVNLYVADKLNLVGAGPAEILQPFTWGSHVSTLVKTLKAGHNKVKLKQNEWEAIYAWLDLNGGYYPTYESAFDETLVGRSPLTNPETDSLMKLTGVNFWSLNTHQRGALAQISFERPELSPALYKIRNDKEKFNKAVEIIKIGAKRLKETPRGDIEDQLVVHPRLQAQVDNYENWLKQEKAQKEAYARGERITDKE